MKTKQIISTLVIVLTLSLLVLYIYKNINDFKQLLNIHSYYIIPLFILTFIGLFLNGYILDILLTPFKIKINKKEKLLLPILTNFYNYITPFRGGMAARAIYLKKKYNLTYTDFLGTTLAVYLLAFFIASLAAIISLLLIKFNLLIFIFLLIIFLILTVIIITAPKIKLTKYNMLNRFIKVINDWNLIKKNKPVIYKTFIITLFQLFLSTLSVLLCYKVLGIDIGFTKALFISSISSLSIVISITPGNLGIGDAISVFSANLVGIDLTQAVGATIISRAVGLLIIFIIGPIATYYLLKKE
nr:hypothetical protein [Nanoarchaeum sp.]